MSVMEHLKELRFRLAVIMGAVILGFIVATFLPLPLPHERRYLFLLLPGVSVSFAIGAGFAYAFMLPAMIAFLLHFGGNIIEQKWAFSEYLDMFSTVMFWMGVVFEMPLIIYFLTKL